MWSWESNEIKEAGLEWHQLKVPMRHSRESVKWTVGEHGKVWAGDTNMGMVIYDRIDEIVKKSTAQKEKGQG